MSQNGHDNVGEVDEPPPTAPVAASVPEKAKKKKNPGGRQYKKQGESEFETRLREVLFKYFDQFQRAGTGRSAGVCQRRSDVLDKVMNELHFHFSWYCDPRRAKNATVPSIGPLKPYDPELKTPVPLNMTEEEDDAYMKRAEAFRKSARDRLDYMVKHPQTTPGGSTSPNTNISQVAPLITAATVPDYTILEPEHKGRVRAVWQEWQVRSTEREEINEAIVRDFEEDVRLGNEPNAKQVPIRYRQAKIRQLFNALPDNEQELWTQAVREERDVRRESRKNNENALDSATPEQRQAAIDKLGVVLSKLMDEAMVRAGVHMVAYVYGPMPKDNGAMGCTTYCSGRTNEPSPVYFTKKMSNANTVHRGRIMKFASMCFTEEDILKARPSPDSPLLVNAIHQDEVEVGEPADADDDVQRGTPFPSSSNSPPATPPTSRKRKRATKDKATPAAKHGNRAGVQGGKRNDRDASDDSETDEDNESLGSRSDLDGEENKPENIPKPKQPGLSAYEIQREKNIAFAKAQLAALGLDQPIFPPKQPPRKKPRRQKSAATHAPRRSLRARQMAANNDEDEGGPATLDADPPEANATPEPDTTTLGGPETNATPAEQPQDTSVQSMLPSVDPLLLAQSSSTTCVPQPSARSTPPPADSRHTSNSAPAAGAKSVSAPASGGLDAGKELDLLEDANTAAVTAPTWFSFPHEVFRDKDMVLGREWGVLVAHWTLLESEGRFSKPLKDLPKGGTACALIRCVCTHAWKHRKIAIFRAKNNGK